MAGGYVSYVTRVVRGQSCMMLYGFQKAPDAKLIHELLDSLATKEKITPCDYHILFQCKGVWNGFIYATDQFVPLGEEGWLQAAIKMIENAAG